MGFRSDFVWGAATASYQIEGAFAEDGKGENIWDVFTHTEGKIKDNSTGDTACDHYHRFRADVKLMKELGLKAYRFSVSWSRIIPDGTGKINQAGIDFYNELINELISQGIEPYMTLYHWDLPYQIHLKGGWLNDNISDWFGNFAKVVAESFGDRVKNYITFNEPQVFTGCGYMQGVHAPGYKLAERELIHIGVNIHKAHGKAVTELRKVDGANIGFTIATQPPCPIEEKDTESARNSYFWTGRKHFVFAESFWLDPIVLGKYPENILSECADILPDISEEDMRSISQPIDFIGLNIYTGRVVRADGDRGCETVQPCDGAAINLLDWVTVPESLYWGPKFIGERYKLPVYITENGFSAHDSVSLDGKVHDPNRQDFLNRYLLELRRAAEDGADIRGYFQWSLMDNFEWAYGYGPRFGMIFVDYNTGERIPKDSALWYRSVIESNGDTL